VAGESGLGKTTFLNTLLKDLLKEELLIPNRSNLGPGPAKTLEISEIGAVHDLEYDQGGNSSKVSIHLFDTPGYGDKINNQESIDHIQCDLYKRHQKWIGLRKDFQFVEADCRNQDERIHVCLYFLNSHRMKDIDLLFIEQLSDLVPIVPVVAKADTMTIQERVLHLTEVKILLRSLEMQKNQNFEEPIIFPFEEDWQEAEYKERAMQLELWKSGQDGSDRKAEQNSPDIQQVVIDNSLQQTMNFDESTIATPVNLLNPGYPFTQDASPILCVASNISVDVPSQSFFVVGEKLMGDSVDSQGQSELCARAHNEANDISFSKIHFPNVFAVVADPNGRRTYPWGTLEIQDENHSDFKRLQTLFFFCGKLEQMIRSTNNKCRRIEAKKYAPSTPKLFLSVAVPKFKKIINKLLPFILVLFIAMYIQTLHSSQQKDEKIQEGSQEKDDLSRNLENCRAR